MLLPARVAIHTVPANRVLHDKYVKTSPESITYPDSKIHGANIGPTWGRQDPGGPHVGYGNLATWVNIYDGICSLQKGLKCVEIEDLKLIQDVCARHRYQ